MANGYRGKLSQSGSLTNGNENASTQTISLKIAYRHLSKLL